jgi:WhiB family redox-sensing transcriptional regulator
VRRGWRAAALCAATDDPDLWFPAGLTAPYHAQIHQAKTTCLRCPVLRECREWALTHGTDDGIWGGLDWEELRLLRRRERRGKGRSEPLPCGTPAAYRRHLRNGEPIDNACRTANRLAKAAQAERAGSAAVAA